MAAPPARTAAEVESAREADAEAEANVEVEVEPRSAGRRNAMVV